MAKPIIIALCGKSAAGKDSTAVWLGNTLVSKGLKSHLIISDTTRPSREGEKYGVNYNFINKSTFEQELRRGNYIESTIFRGWYYGTHKSEIDSDVDMINIGVFNLDGLKQLEKHRRDFNIIAVYLNDNWWDRLRRSHDREGRWRLEHLRRLFVDWFHFLGVNKELNKFRYNLTIKNANGVVRKSRRIIEALIQWKIIEPGQNSISKIL